MQKTVTVEEARERKYPGFKFTPTQKVNVPLLADAVVNFECRLVTEYCLDNRLLLIGKIIASHVNIDESVKRLINYGIRI